MKRLHTSIALGLLAAAVPGSTGVAQPLSYDSSEGEIALVAPVTWPQAAPDSAPPRPAVFYGSVRLDGADVPAGTDVSAWIDGVKYAEAATTVDDGTSVYSIDVPADDPDTAEIEGGTDGQLVTFNVGSYAVDQRAYWHDGEVTPLHLTARRSSVVTPTSGVPTPTPGPTAVPVLHDTFDDGVIDDATWTAYALGTGPTVAETNGRLEITMPATSTGDPTTNDLGAGYESIFTLRGDFDVEVDYRLPTWPASNGVWLGIGTNDTIETLRVSMSGTWFPGVPRETYWSIGGSQMFYLPTTDTSGKLRLARSGSTMASYYFRDGEWMEFYSDSAPLVDLPLLLEAWTKDEAFGDQNVAVAFDNLIVRQGQLIFPSGAVAPPAGLVSWWPAQGNASDVTGLNHGTPMNGVRFPDGNVGMAFELNGRGDYVEIPDDPSLTPESLSIDAWVKTDTIDGDHAVISKYDASTDQRSWLLLLHDTGAHLQDGRLRFVVYADDLGSTYRQVETSHRVILPGVWYHVAATFDAATQDMKIFVNGAEKPTTLEPGSTTVETIFDDASPARIGSYVDGAGDLVHFWDGRIDEVDLFARALTAQEVQAIYAAGSAGKRPPEMDADGDGVIDAADVCPATEAGTPVDGAGCSVVCAGGPPPAGLLAQADSAPGTAHDAGSTRPAKPTRIGEGARGQSIKSYGDLTLFFVENRGQLDERVAYSVQGSDKTLYLTPDGITFALNGTGTINRDPEAAVQARALGSKAAVPEPGPGSGPLRWAVKLDFIDANPDVTPAGIDPLVTKVSYFKGPRDEWQPGLGTFGSVVYRDLWPGIDLVYSGTSNRLKYHFLVKPGADPGQIRLRYRGASSVSVDDEGRLEVSTPVGGFHDDQPFAYQEEGAERVEVAASYALDAEPDGDGFAYGFRVGDYDRRRPLVIDPTIFIYAGFIGGNKDETGFAIDVDAAGCAYVAGYTNSAEDSFPVRAGPDLSHNGGMDSLGNRIKDAFVAKVNAAGTSLIYAGFIGGSLEDWAYGIAADANGNAYVTGATYSTNGTFPALVGPDLVHRTGAFITKIAADGTQLLYSGFIGGNRGNGIAVDDEGSAYVTGAVYAAAATTFPVTSGPDLSYNSGYTDAFVVKVKPDGTGLEYAGFIGGSGYDEGSDIDIDSCGNAYVTGHTYSFENTFPDGDGFGPTGMPGSVEGSDTTFNGKTASNPDDAFVVKVVPDGSGLAYASYIGGDGADFGHGIAVDGAGSAYVVGLTNSAESSFPDGDGFGSVPGPDQAFAGNPYPAYGPSTNAFVAKLSVDGRQLEYAGYIGGGHEYGDAGIAVDAAGAAYVAGSTSSVESLFPVKDGPDLVHGGCCPGYLDGYVVKVAADGSEFEYAGYIGGANDDQAMDIAVDGAGYAYVAGHTNSGADGADPFPVTRGPDTTYVPYVDGPEAFVAKIGDPSAAAPLPSALPPLECNPDADHDGVADADDACPGTPSNASVNAAGCPVDECYPLPPIASSWWMAEDSAVDAVDGNHGTLVNDVTFEPGVVGKAFRLAGSDDVVEIPDSASLTPGASGFAIEGWVQPDAHGMVFSDHYGCRNYESLYLSTSAFVVNPSSSGGAARTAQTLTYPALTLNEWSHVAAVWDRDQMSVYVNGQLVAVKQAPNAPWNPTSPFVIGGLKETLNCWPGTGYYGSELMGDVDDLTFYRRALTAPEIRAIHLAGIAGKCPFSAPPCTTPDLVSWWPGDGHTRDIVSHLDGVRWNGTGFALGRVGQALDLDGFDDYIEVWDSPAHTPSSMTLDAWVEATSLGAVGVIASKYDTKNNNRQVSWILFATETGVLRFTVYGPEGWTAWRGVESTAPVLSTGQWHHVAASFDKPSQTMAIYVDGHAVPVALLVGSTAISSIMDSTSPVRIGAYVPSTGTLDALWKGRIDELGLHRRALAPAEIRDIYAFGGGGRCNLPNIPPTADAQGPYEVNEGAAVAVNGTGEDPELRPVTFAWDLDDDGTFETSGQSVTFSAAALDGPTTVSVTLQVCDEDGACATDGATVNVLNVAPTIDDLANDGPIDEASSATISAIAGDPAGTADPLSYEFDCDGDGSYDIGPQAGSSATCDYADDGAFEATVRVSDGDGGEATGTTTVVVNNVAPVITSITNDSPIDEGTRATITVTAEDVAGAHDPLSYELDCNHNGFYETRPAGNSASCPFSDNGTFEVPVRVSDGDGGEATASSTVVVDNVPPTATFNAPESVEQGEELALSLTDAADRSYKDEAAGFTYAFDCGEGAGFGDLTATNTTDCPSEVVGVRTVRGKIRDKDGGETVYAADVSVEGGVPEITAVTNDGPINEGGSATITVIATHPSGPAEPLTYAFDCDNDGSFEVGPQPASSAACPFGDDGTYPIPVRVADSDGDEDTGATTVAVLNVSPSAAPDAASVVEDGPATTVDVLANDTDPARSADPLSITAIDSAGTVGAVIMGLTDVAYDPNGQFEWLATGESATDSFEYTITDADGGYDSATVTVSIAGVNDFPTVQADHETVTVNEGDIATNLGAFHDIDGSDSVVISASPGSITDQGPGNIGSWSWSFETADGPADSQQVAITADDGHDGTAQATFQLVVLNVAPSFELGADLDLAPSALGVFERSVQFSDPGQDQWSGTVDYGDGTEPEGLVVSSLNRTFVLGHTYTAEGGFTIEVTLDDGDGGSHTDSFVITVDLDTDDDGVFDAADACDKVPGFPGAVHQGCPVADENYVTLHHVDQRKPKTVCPGGAGSCKEAIVGAEVRVFDRNKLNGLKIRVDNEEVTLPKNPNGGLYPEVFEQAAAALVGSCTTTAMDGDPTQGYCAAGEPYAGDLLVIVKYVDQDDTEGFTGTVFTGLPKSGTDFVDTNDDGVGDLATKHFQVIKVYKKDNSIQIGGGSKTVLLGSYLEIIAPDYAVWEVGASAYVYPFIFTADSDWDVDVCAEVPAGYDIVGVYDEYGDLVSTTDCHQALVANQTRVVAFEVEDLESPKPKLKLKLKVKHKGKSRSLDLETPGHRKGKDKPDKGQGGAGGVTLPLPRLPNPPVASQPRRY